MHLPVFVRYLLFPFAVLYGAGVWLRNKLFDFGILKEFEFDFPVIVVGNLTVGGTGKTPMTIYLLKIFSEYFKTASLSRGYRRKTSGFLEVNPENSFQETGDEPLLIKRYFPDCPVAVCEDRIEGVQQLLVAHPDLKAAVLDDAFQHRYLKPGFNILLTDYSNLFADDFLLPSGSLRESRSGASRADAIVVTKCPVDLPSEDVVRICGKIALYSNAKVYFASLSYPPYVSLTAASQNRQPGNSALLVCGIANPESLKQKISLDFKEVKSLIYEDHHAFSPESIQVIEEEWKKLPNGASIITTAKDAMRLEPFRNLMEEKKLPVFVLPVEMKFLFDDEEKFTVHIFNYIKRYIA